MTEYTTLQAYVPNNIAKRVDLQPERKELNLSVSKTVGILVKEALDAREAAKNKKEKVK